MSTTYLIDLKTIDNMGAYRSMSISSTLSFMVTETTSTSDSISSYDNSHSETTDGSSSSDIAKEFLDKKLADLKLDKK